MSSTKSSSIQQKQSLADSKQDLSSFVMGQLQQLAIAPLQQALLSWYGEQGRDLPWRRTRNPYEIWISEIMLQQTQVKTVIPYYERWLAQFPTVEALAIATQQQVLKVWQGLGYYARARNLHRAAQAIVQEYGGQFPSEFEAVLALPGIGRTTAGGILSAAFDLPTPILDGNVKRVLARLIALPVPPNRALEWLWQISMAVLDTQHPRDFNQALMDLGATVCTPKNPACLLCPWREFCQAYRLNMQNELPTSETRAPLPRKFIGVAVIWDDQGNILIDRRRQEGLLGGLWEFPGGKVEPGETIEECIKREIQEELGIDIEVGDRLVTVNHTYSHFHVTLNVHHCRHLSGEPQPIESDEVKWVALDDLHDYPFPKANVQIIDALLSYRAETNKG
ncbi:MAG: A/G-specific adenine glycosylase [Oculatellaceae cyanobacterium bins.114]|nr:A/G-specific adenine glycosylase [Oculatellaceae cyanobacterium bins.114]